MTYDASIGRGDAAALSPEDVMGAKKKKGLSQPGKGLAGPAKHASVPVAPPPTSLAKKSRRR